MSTHPPLDWAAGDDWEFLVTLLDDTGAPFNLALATIKWALMDAAFHCVLDETDVTITITDAAAGKCTITVSAAITELLGGIYTDIIGIISGGVHSTLSRGSINVAACPWLAQYKPISSSIIKIAAA